jgi:hypothetical protein
MLTTDIGRGASLDFTFLDNRVYFVFAFPINNVILLVLTALGRLFFEMKWTVSGGKVSKNITPGRLLGQRKRVKMALARVGWIPIMVSVSC